MLGHHGVSEAAISSLRTAGQTIEIGLAIETDYALPVQPQRVLDTLVTLYGAAQTLTFFDGSQSIVINLDAGWSTLRAAAFEAEWSLVADLRGSTH